MGPSYQTHRSVLIIPHFFCHKTLYHSLNEILLGL